MIFRPLTTIERETVRNFYLSLSPDDRRKRFCCTISDEAITKYTDRLDFTRDTILGAFDEHLLLVGIAELVHGPAESEMAFSVRQDRRGQKIGTKLIQKLLQHARMHGVGQVFVQFLSDNTPMRKMARRAGMTVDTVDGESHAARKLSAPSAEELARWSMEGKLSYSDYLGTFGSVRLGSFADRSKSETPQPLKDLAPAD